MICQGFLQRRTPLFDKNVRKAGFIQRVIEDDDQYTLNVALVSKMSKETACHITLLEQRDAADFFSLRSGDHGFGCLYDGL